MLKQFMFQNGFYTVIFAFCFIGILGKICEWTFYRKFIKEAENAGKSDNNTLKQLKLKVKSCYRLDLQIKNTRAFIEAYLYKCKCLGIRIGSIHSCGISAMLLCSGAGIVAVMTGIRYQIGVYPIIYHAGAAMFSILVIQLMEAVFACEEKKQEIMVILEDYLDNFLINRLEHKEIRSVHMSAAEATAVSDTIEKNESNEKDAKRINKEQMKHDKDKENTQPYSYSENQEKDRVIAEILSEFLT